MNTEAEDEILVAALKAFGDIVRRQRQISQWSYYVLSGKTGIDVVTISAMENGENVASEVEREFWGSGSTPSPSC